MTLRLAYSRYPSNADDDRRRRDGEERRAAGARLAAVGPVAGLDAGARPPSPRPQDPSRESRRGLDWFAFFVANLQTGFGPFIAVYLTTARWTQVDIGIVLSLGGLIALIGQVPGGALVDAVRSKHVVAAVSVALIGISALLLGSSAYFPVILAAWMIHAAASCTLSPAIGAMSLGLVGHRGIGTRLGRNASFGSVGNACAAAGMGACGTYVSNQAVFFVTAVLVVPALFALFQVRRTEIDPVLARGGTADEPENHGATWRVFLTNRPLVVLVAAIALFHFANAAMLPLVGSMLTLRTSGSAAILIAACIIVPQAMTAVLSPWVGRLAQSWGRRPLLLLGFAALPVRGLCLGLVRDPTLLVLVQVCDGVSAAVLGVLVPLIAADATRRTGHFALAQGMIGTGVGLGAALSTTVGGYLADRLGSSTAFTALGGIGVFAFLTVLVLMPETRPRR